MSSRILYTAGKEKKIEQKRRRRIAPFMLIILSGAAIIGGIFAVYRPQWQISVVTVRGLRMIPDSAVHESVGRVLAGAYLWIVPHSFILTVRESAVAARIQKEFPEIQEIAVHKQFPNRLDIAVTERSLWGIFCNDLMSAASSTCVAMDASGYAYASSPELTGLLVTRVRSDGADVAVGSSATDPDTMDRLRILRENLPGAAGSAPVDFQLRKDMPGEIRVAMPEGYNIIFKHDDDFINAFRVLKKVLDEEIGDKRTKLDYVDLRFGNKVFYKLK